MSDMEGITYFVVLTWRNRRVGISTKTWMMRGRRRKILSNEE